MSIETTLTVALMGLLLGGLLLLRLLIGLIAWIAGKLFDLYAPGRTRPEAGPAPASPRAEPTHRVTERAAMGPQAPLRRRAAGLGGALMEIGHDLGALATSAGRRAWKIPTKPAAEAPGASAGRPVPYRVLDSARRGLDSMRTTARDLVSPPAHAPRPESAEDHVRVLAVESASQPPGNGHVEVEAQVIVLESWDPALDEAPADTRAGDRR
jgi:hypothetical protein